MANSRCAVTRRDGLAPLEFVAALPLLLFVMALVVNFSFVANWKVQTLVEARRHHGLEGNVPKLLDAANAADPSAVDGLIPHGVTPNRDLLDPTKGLYRGSSSADRKFPMLSALLGDYSVHAEHRLLDDKWPYSSVDWPEARWNLPVNTWRRVPAIYATYWVANWQGYLTAARNLVRVATSDALRPLETWRDDEFVGYAQRFGWPIPHRDFHPPLPQACTTDHAAMDHYVQDLVDRIQGRDAPPRIPGVPEALARGFQELYQSVIDELTRQMQATPPPPPSQVIGMQNEIDQLKRKIDTLQRFIDSL